MNSYSILLAIFFAFSFSFLLVFVFYDSLRLSVKIGLIIIAFFLFILSYGLIDNMLGKPRITKLEFVEGDSFIYLSHDCIEPNKINNSSGKMYIFYRKEEGNFFSETPELSEFPYDRRYCVAFAEARKYQIYKFEKVNSEEVDNFNENELEKKLQAGEKYYSVDDKWMLEMIETPKKNLPPKD